MLALLRYGQHTAADGHADQASSARPEMQWISDHGGRVPEHPGTPREMLTRHRGTRVQFTKPLNSQDHIRDLLRWAEWGRRMPQPTAPNWEAVDQLIAAAEPRLEEDSALLRDILDRSSLRLGLPDPFLSDLGVHRWLDNENAYSDWLAWTLEQLRDGGPVIDLLGVLKPEVARLRTSRIRVQREELLDEGRPGAPGRIDLLVHFNEPTQAVLAVEVKTSDEQYEKQRGYLHSLKRLARRQGVPYECILVANSDVPQESRYGFRLIRWEEVSVALRKAVGRRARDRDDLAVRAMMLAFVAAIEQNLLGFGAGLPRRAKQQLPILLPPGFSEYLKKIRELQQ